MNAYLPLAALFERLRDIEGVYLFPILAGVALTIVLVILLFGRRRGGIDAALDDDADDAPVTEPAPPLGPPAKDVLVVDDSAVVRAKLRKLLEGAGYAVELARDGLEAQQALAAAQYSLLITDLEMPNLGGMELIASVQGSLETEDLPIIAITGHDELHAHVRDYQGLYGIFKKPWNDRDLLKRVETLVRLRASRTVPGALPAAALSRRG
ncbi:MAG: response regulator [Proteobacteria bacterium]|nr:response regulator [Pseudomonadota bacterium]